MKKYLFMAVAGMLALSSCSNDNDELVVKDVPQTMTFTAGFADEDASRAAIGSNDDDWSVTWESSDRIKVFSAKNSNGTGFWLSSGQDSNSATFTGTAVNDSKFYAVYPEMGKSLEGTTIEGLTIYPDQVNPAWFSEFSEETSGLDKISAFAVAVAEPGHPLQFKCICAILKMELTIAEGGQDNVTVRVQASETETMAAAFNYNTEDGTYQIVDEKSNYVQTMSSVCVKGTRTLYLKVLPGDYTNFELIVSNGEGTIRYKKKNNVAFEAGKVYDLGSCQVGGPIED